MKTAMLILAGLIVFITGCTANGPAFSPAEPIDANKAVVYVYRPFSIIGCAQTPKVYIDEVKYDPLKNNGYLVYFVGPGKRMVEVRDPMWGEPLTIYPDFTAGEKYYVRFSYDSKVTTIEMQLAVIPEEYAIREISRTKKSE